MSLWSRLTNLFHSRRLTREIDEELQSHLDEAAEQGRDPAEIRRAFGSPLRWREESRDLKFVPWLDSLRADAIFGWRQLRKRKVTSAAAIFSLGLAIGACATAFRLIDALLLRPLPVKNADRLYALVLRGEYDGHMESVDAWAYPGFRLMRDAVRDQAELIAVSYSQPVDLTYRAGADMEKASVEYVSGGMFDAFGLRPRLGRLLTAADDREPGAHPVAVISYDYWTRRFAQDPSIVGRTFRLASPLAYAGPPSPGNLYQIIGVAREPFTGTEPGAVTDLFIPTMMHPAAVRDDATWHRILAIVHPGAPIEPLRARLDSTWRAFETARARSFGRMSPQSLAKFLTPTVHLDPASSGASSLQNEYRRALLALGALVALVLFIACANVANLMTAQTASRSRELALRVSIGAGRARLVQMGIIEALWTGLLAASAGALFAWWAAPAVVARIDSPGHPAHLALSPDGRVLLFGLALTLLVTCVLALPPALRALAVEPSGALKGGSNPHSRRRLMHALIAVQVAFCFLVIFVAGLFVATFDRLSHRPLGFSPGRLLAVETVAQRPAPPIFWEQTADRLRAAPGVESVALSRWTLLDGNAWNGFLSIDGAPPGPLLAYFLSVSPGWLDAMRIPLVDGRDFRDTDTSPGEAIVNQTLARVFFPGENPLGKRFAKGTAEYQIVGVTRDAPYRNLRESIPPVAYVPFRQVDSKNDALPVRTSTFIIRTSLSDPLALSTELRREIPRARPEFRVSNIRDMSELVRSQTLRERLLATLALFFAAVALLLAAIGLYGVLDYSVLERRREIGIRMAIGAGSAAIIRGVTARAFVMVLTGAAAGLALGAISVRYIEALLYQAKPSDPAAVAVPVAVILAVALLAALPPALRAVRIDPVETLRSE